MSNSPYNSSEPPALTGTAHTQAQIRRFALKSWLSIYGSNCLWDFVKETDYADLENEHAKTSAALAAAHEESAALLARCAALREALKEINGLRSKWPNWEWEGLYEEADEIARTTLVRHYCQPHAKPDAPREDQS